MKNTTILFLVIAMIVLAGGFVFVNGESTITGNVVSGGSLTGEMQRVVISQDGYNYKDAVAEEGKPIAISLDSSVQGCLRAINFNLDGKKYSQYLKSESDVLQLPALKKGTYSFSCSMGMGFGKLIIK
ncbi:MAG: hypothetical protein Q8P57_00105 [Candidatus Pacearchaeota archaeon]|nr:hypothetical protein [Candidatus Pacearchaeota archaeon]